MRIDESSEQRPPDRMEALSDTGYAPQGAFSPMEATTTELGPLADTPIAPPPVATGGQVEAITEGASLSPVQASLRRLGRDKRAMTCLAIVLVLIVLSYIGPFIYVHIGPTISGGTAGTPIGPDVYHVYTHQELFNQDQNPSAAYPLGTDQLGRDILARIMAGISVSIQVALIVETMDVVLGVAIGTLAAFYGGWIDTFLARFTDVMFAFPGLLFAILAAATLGTAFSDKLGPSGRLILVSLALGISVWPQMARYVRGQTLQLKEQQFVEASRTVGGSNFSIILRHLIPNLFSIVVVAATLDIVTTIINEAIISLLGLGVRPPGSSLGLMINDAIRQISINPTEVIWPTLVLAVLVIAFSFLGDGVRDAFDPRTKD